MTRRERLRSLYAIRDEIVGIPAERGSDLDRGVTLLEQLITEEEHAVALHQLWTERMDTIRTTLTPTPNIESARRWAHDQATDPTTAHAALQRALA